MAKKTAKTKALTKWDKELAAAAEAAAAQEANTGGGQFFSLRGGTLKLNDAPIPNDEMAVVIVDSVLENTYYDQDFDPDSPSAPVCYAFGRDEDTMGPFKDVEEPQCETCAECEQNKWGSADRGRGKACRNRRRLALISAGSFDKNGDIELIEDPGHFEKEALTYLALPPTSINSYGAYVKQIAGALKRPPHAVVTRIALVDDAKTQFKVVFELIEPLADELIGALMQRHAESRETIEFPYAQIEEEAKPSRRQPARRKAKTKKKARSRKY